MKEFVLEILKRIDLGQAVALCVVVETRGSTPQKRGAIMLVFGDGVTMGTLGGGCVEAEVRREAVGQISRGESRTVRFSLDHDYGWDDGLICGGVMLIHMRVVGAGDRAWLEKLAEELAAEREVEFRLPYEVEGARHEFVRKLIPPGVLVIAGAGHVGFWLAKLAGDLNFLVDVIDDRAEFLNRERFPSARQLICGEIETELKKYPVEARSYVVIVTRGHRNDGRALAAVAGRDAAYVGLIGSKRKIKTIMDDLAASGVDYEWLKSVHAPVGLDIGAVTVPEIAISIMAELVAARAGKSSSPAMKMSDEELEKWLTRAKRVQ